MNKSDKLIVVLLFIALFGLTFIQKRSAGQRAAAEAARRAELERIAATNVVASAGTTAATATDATATPSDGPALGATPSTQAAIAAPDFDEERVTLRSDELEIEVSNRGGAIVQAILPEFKATRDKDSPPVTMDFSDSPALALSGIPGIDANSRFTLTADEGGTSVVARAATADGLILERTITLLPRCEIAVRESFRNPGGAAMLVSSNEVSLGEVIRGTSRNDILGIDARPVETGKAVHWDTRLMKSFGVSGFGCGGAPDASSMPRSAVSEVFGNQEWLAIKSRFFVSLFSSDEPGTGYTFDVERDTRQQRLSLYSVSARYRFGARELAAGGEFTRSSTLYIGPKRLSYLWGQGHHRYQVMQFGWLTWVCLLLVPLLNGLAAISGGNYGVAIILVTIIIRLLLWPLTHKGAEGAKRMQAIQPQLKALQEKFKDDPQKLQQETLILYRTNKVNPMSSCLPLLLQMPVLIAMYTVLRSAIELRYAPFLWIADLSEAENLLEGMLPPPIYSLNILPILMAATMIVQSKLTPNMGGDQSQQKMMMWMMPIMMLFMFYPLSSGLVLYWTVSNILAIAQMWLQQRAAKKSVPASQAVIDADDPGMTRQMRRRMSR